MKFERVAPGVSLPRSMLMKLVYSGRSDPLIHLTPSIPRFYTHYLVTFSMVLYLFFFYYYYLAFTLTSYNFAYVLCFALWVVVTDTYKICGN